MIANLGDILVDKLPECLPVYVSRLKNEITRLTTVRAITMISRSLNKHTLSQDHYHTYTHTITMISRSLITHFHCHIVSVENLYHLSHFSNLTGHH